MTQQELRLRIMELVWPDAASSAQADPAHFIAKARAVEAYLSEGQAEQAPGKPEIEDDKAGEREGVRQSVRRPRGVKP